MSSQRNDWSLHSICSSTSWLKKKLDHHRETLGARSRSARRQHDQLWIHYLVVADGDYNRNRELFLKHQYEGSQLDQRYARKALEHVHTLWGHPVHPETVIDEESVVMHYDGEEHDMG